MKKLLLIFLFVLTLCACGLQEESVLEEPEILESSATKPVENELKEEKLNAEQIKIKNAIEENFNEENCIIAGNPARIVKKNINWDGARPKEWRK